MTNFIDDAKIPRLFVDQEAGKPLVLIHIDCGHGSLISGIYQTKGKQYDHGEFIFYEGQFNRRVGKLLATKFINNHISYSFTTISNEDTPLSKRIEHVAHVMRAYPNHKHLLLSIHGNAAGVETATGFEFFSTEGVTDSDYASNFYVPYIYDLNMRFRITRPVANEYDKEENFYVIRKAEALGAMALLFECGFFSNKAEATRMLTPEFQNQLTDVLLKGTQDIIKTIKEYGNIRKI